MVVVILLQDICLVDKLLRLVVNGYCVGGYLATLQARPACRHIDIVA